MECYPIATELLEGPWPGVCKLKEGETGGENIYWKVHCSCVKWQSRWLRDLTPDQTGKNDWRLQQSRIWLKLPLGIRIGGHFKLSNHDW